MMIQAQDCVNGLFEVSAGFFVLLHCRKVVKDKAVKGVSVVAVAFFTLWGIWNIYYYPFLGQWISFAGGLFVTSTNAIYIALILTHRRK